MLKSMTGYGEGSGKTALGLIRIEVKSVNHRFFDTRISLPRELSFIEPEFREELRKKIKRGMLFINLYWEKSPSALGKLKLDRDLVQSLKNKLKELGRDIKVSSQTPLGLIANFPGVLYFESMPLKGRTIKPVIHKALKQALDNLVKAREKEGKQIEKDLKNRLALIKKETVKVEKFLPQYKKELKRKIKEKFRLIQTGKELDRERLNKELTFTLIRSDFTEEIVRAKNHIKSLDEMIGKGVSGKKIDFFLQEINREINTLSDKASSVNISKIVIKIKIELEKIREQSANLE